jgi:hypothetical protein
MPRGLLNIQTLAGNSDRRKTHIFGQGLPFKQKFKLFLLAPNLSF